MASSRARKRTEAKKPITVASFLRSFLVGVFVAVGVLGIAAYTVVSWVQKNILDTENWVSLVETVPKQPAVTQAFSDYIVTKMFDRADVEQHVADALPDQAAFLAPPLSDQLEAKTTSVTEQFVAGDNFQTIWVAANQAAHERLIEIARGSPTRLEQASDKTQQLQLDISQTRDRIRERLGVSAAILPVRSDENPLKLQVDLQLRSEQLRRYTHAADFAYAVLPSLILASVLTALAVARNRRRVLMIASLVAAGMTLLQLICIKALRPVVLSQVENTSYHPAVGELYDMLLGSFNTMAYAVLAVSLVVWGLTLVAGSSRFFRWVRKYFKTSKLRRTDYYEYWQEVRMVVAMYKPYVWGVFAALALLWLAFVVEVDWQSVANTLLMLLAGLSSVQILGTPPYFIKARR